MEEIEITPNPKPKTLNPKPLNPKPLKIVGGLLPVWARHLRNRENRLNGSGCRVLGFVGFWVVSRFRCRGLPGFQGLRLAVRGVRGLQTLVYFPLLAL